MKLLGARFKNYSILYDNEFEFDKNPYIWTAPNESGKSTLIMGIRDAFLLDPLKLKDKRTIGKNHDPIIELKFSIDKNTYHLKINAQDSSIVLKGSDGVNLGKKNNILKFLNSKGYHYFPSVLEYLLIFRERDLAVSTTHFRELLDSLFKTANTENLKKVIDGFLRLRGTEYFKGSLGSVEKDVREKYIEAKNEYMKIIEKHAAYERNRRLLKESRDRIDKIKKGIEEVENSRSELLNKKKLAEWRMIQVERDNLEQRVSELKEDIEKLRKRKQKIDSDIDILGKELDRLVKDINKLTAEAGKIQGLKKELRHLKEKIEICLRMENIEQKLGKWSKAELKTLEKELAKWQAFEVLSRESEGVIRIVRAGDTVFVNDIECRKEASFKGSAKIRYRDLELNVYSQRDIAEQEAKIKEYEDKYSDQENLKRIISLLRERDSIKKTLVGNETLDDLEKRKSEAEKEVKKAESANSEIDKKQEEKVSLEGDLKKLGEQRDKIAKELYTKEEGLNNLLKKLEEKESELKSMESDNTISSINLRDVDDIYRRTGDELSKLIAQIARKIEEKSNKLRELEEEKNELERNIKYYEGLTSEKPDESKLERFLLEMQSLDRKLRNFEKAARVLHYGKVVIEKLIKEINNRYLKFFENRTGEIFQNITGGRYAEVDFVGDSLFFSQDEFKRGWLVRGSDAEFTANELSDGAFSQLLLSARLALIRMFFRNQAFLFFDEPFAYFDFERERNTMRILQNLASEGWQIIIVSAKDVNSLHS